MEGELNTNSPGEGVFMQKYPENQIKKAWRKFFALQKFLILIFSQFENENPNRLEAE